jgi:membrane fusion protein, multidrug efflux system
MRLALCVSVLASILAVSAFAQQQEATIIVGTVSAERTPIAKTLEFVGRVEAVNRVQINARVKGFLENVLFKEGELVKKGDPLYRIEQGTFEAAVQQTQGALERSKGAKALTEIQLQRAEQLLKSQSGSAVARDQAKAADEQANGAILSDEASLKTAEINLSYTDIRSPISGRIGRTAITTGNVVGPETGLLTLIVSQDPMYVTFPVSQREFLKAQKENRAVDIRQIKVRLRFSDGSAFDQEGSVNFVDVTVDKTTDTIIARATMPNPNGALTDSQLVRVLLESSAPEEKIVIPQTALIADQEGIYVFLIEDGKAAVRRVTPGAETGTGVIIEKGLSGGELVIVEGLQKIRPGVSVRAKPLSTTIGQN